ncbi:hypothetical protein BBK82_36560 [Lentzea guizhouensis]|uniref:Uncharacterized protein n=1 Tax=Lentzea guizhouensis TaxID=1586287 RepID=A0A1B2HSJ0_9PSEU|nr:hypothetical protein [Lentzea guizhouensis]ANZ40694.1 hypothetical protein BBK82_36560 [Lentzea guizhouensis]
MGDLSMLHPSDRLVVAGEPVPDDLAPLDPTAGGDVVALVRTYLRLPPEERAVLRTTLAGLPQLERTVPARVPTAHHIYATSQEPGAVVMRMLGNRNLGWTVIAKLLLVVTGRYWAAATCGGVGRGVKELTPDLLADFGTVLDIASADLARLTGVTPSRRADPGVSSLIWDLRRLSSGQIRSLTDQR